MMTLGKQYAWLQRASRYVFGQIRVILFVQFEEEPCIGQISFNLGRNNRRK